MNERELALFDRTPIRVRITDPYLSMIEVRVGNVVYSLESGHIPLEVRYQCDRPKDEPEMSL